MLIAEEKTMTPKGGYDEAQEIYDKARITGKVGFGRKSAVVVVDLSYGFTDSGCTLGADLGDVVKENRRLLDAAREKGLPIFFTTVAYRQDMSDAGVWREKFPSLDTLKEGNRDVEIDDRLGRRPSEPLLVKKYPSAFFGTPLASHLIALGVDTLIVTGATTSGCVRATVVDSLQYGFRTIVPEECVGDRAEAPHRANLFDMGSKYADVMPVEEVLAKVRKM
ncbi:MAG: isochorismatase family protein [Nitrospinota bacterium]